mgnify:CR=1 FL=1
MAAAENGPLVEKGEVYAFDDALIKDTSVPTMRQARGELDYTQGDTQLVVRGSDVELVFDKAEGAIRSWKVKGKDMIDPGFGLKPNYWRAPIDNDYGNYAPIRTQYFKEPSAPVDVQAVKENGTVGAWVLDAGDYYFAVGNGAHEALNNVLANKLGSDEKLIKATEEEVIDAARAKKITINARDIETYSENVENALTGSDINEFIPGAAEYTTRADWTKGWNTVTGLTATDDMMTGLKNLNFEFTENGTGEVWGAQNGLTLANVLILNDAGEIEGLVDIDDPMWDQLVDEVTFDEALAYVEKGANMQFQFNAVGSYLTVKDGPIGFVNDQVPGYTTNWSASQSDEPTYVGPDNEYAEWYMAVMPTEPVVAATFNTELVEREGELFGEDSLWSNVISSMGPGLNNHRAVYCSRNHEYYSEDPVLSGFTASANAAYVAVFTEVSSGGGTATDITIGSGTSTNAYIPTYAYYKYSLTEQIYTAAEIGQSGTITAVSFKVSNAKSTTRTLAVYLKHTTKTAFTSKKGWEAVSSSNLVYSGSVTFSASGWTTITLDTPFEYNGTNNLLLAVDDNTGSYVSSSSNSPKFYVYSTGANRALRIYSDNTNYNPASPSSYSGTYVTSNNQIMLTMGGNKIVTNDEAVNTESKTLVVFPNPVERGSQVTIVLPEGIDNAKVEVFNAQGACVYSGHGEGNVELPCNDRMTPGLYIVRVSQGNDVFYGKLIVR